MRIPALITPFAAAAAIAAPALVIPAMSAAETAIENGSESGSERGSERGTMPAVEAGRGNERIAAVERQLAAYRAGDLDQFVASFTKDAIVRADGFVAIGHEQIRALYALNFEPGAPRIRVRETALENGKVVLTLAYISGAEEGAGEGAGEGRGEEWCCSTAEYEVTNGKVSFLRTGG